MIRLYDGMYPMPNDMLAEIGPHTDVAIREEDPVSREDRDPPTDSSDTNAEKDRSPARITS